MDLDGPEELFRNVTTPQKRRRVRVFSWARVVVNLNIGFGACRWRKMEAHMGCEQIGGQIRNM